LFENVFFLINPRKTITTTHTTRRNTQQKKRKEKTTKKNNVNKTWTTGGDKRWSP
jgi:hypothetical protein